MRVVFMGAPHFASPSLQALIESPHQIVGVYSQPPRPSGRGMQVTPTPVHQIAQHHNIPVFNPGKFTLEEVEILKQQKPDIICVAAYGLILPQKVLDIAPCLNVHPSALPRWRGAAPINHTILAGDRTTDVCIMAMEKGLDSGPVYLRETFDVSPQETAGSLHDRLSLEGARLLMTVIDDWSVYKGAAEPQAEKGVTYAPKITADMKPTSFNDAAACVRNHIHGLSPFPGATMTLNNVCYKLLEAEVVDDKGSPGTVLHANETHGLVIACHHKALRIKRLQKPGKKAVQDVDFMRGNPPVKAGDICT